MKKFIVYDVNSAKDTEHSLNNLLRVFNDLGEIAETVDYSNDIDRKTYKQYVKSLRRYFEKCEKMILDD